MTILLADLDVTTQVKDAIELSRTKRLEGERFLYGVLKFTSLFKAPDIGVQ